MEPFNTLDEMVKKKLQELTERLDRIEAQAADPDELVFGLRKPKSLFRVRTPGTGHRPEGAGAHFASVPLPVHTLGDVLVYCMLDELAATTRWVADELIPRIGDHKLTLEVLR